MVMLGGDRGGEEDDKQEELWVVCGEKQEGIVGEVIESGVRVTRRRHSNSSSNGVVVVEIRYNRGVSKSQSIEENKRNKPQFPLLCGM